MNKPLAKGIFYILISAIFTCCTPQKKIVYLQSDNPHSAATGSANNFELKIYPNDILSVQVFTDNPEAFPGLNFAADRQIVDNRSAYEKGFAVDDSGLVDLPLIGSIPVSGKTIAQAKQIILAAYGKYMQNPVVVLKKLSYKFTILGEVNKPGLYYVPNEKITFLEALGTAGDLTNYADRTEIKIFRKSTGEMKELTMDLTTQQVLQSEFMYVYPDDVIYIKPIKRKALANSNPGVVVITSIITTAAVVISLILRNQ